jgi:hypothetical protein
MSTNTNYQTTSNQGMAYFVEEDIEAAVKNQMYMSYPYEEIQNALNTSGHSFLINVNSLHGQNTSPQQHYGQQQNYNGSYAAPASPTPTANQYYPQQQQQYQQNYYPQQQQQQQQQQAYRHDYNQHVMSPVESLTHQVNNTSFLNSPEVVPFVTSYDVDTDNLFEDNYRTPTENGFQQPQQVSPQNPFGSFGNRPVVQSPMRESPMLNEQLSPENSPTATVNGKSRSLLSLILPKRKKSIQQRKVEDDKLEGSALVRRTSGDHLFNNSLDRRTSNDTSGVSKFNKKIGRHESAPVIGSLTVLNRPPGGEEAPYVTQDSRILVEKPVDKRSKGKGRAPNQFVFVLKRNNSGKKQ